MSLLLKLVCHTPYALQPSSIELRLELENHGAATVRGPEPGPGCLRTLDGRGSPLNVLPQAPWPHPPRILELAPGARHVMEVRSAAAGSMRDVGEYSVTCAWQGAVSDPVRYRVLGERAPYVVAIRRVGPRLLEVELNNRGREAIAWGEPCDPEEDVSVFLGGHTRLPTRIVEGAALTGVAAGGRATLRIEVLEVAPGQAITARFRREPFATTDTRFVA